MTSFHIDRYDRIHQSRWDDFVRYSKNGTFLFLRDYMDYHSDRFEDHSLLVKDAHGNLLCLLPANQCDDMFVSHGGLTYGGFVTADTMKMPKMLQAFDEVMSYLQLHQFLNLRYKTIPHIYHRAPAEEDLYALLVCNARVERRAVLSVVSGDQPLPFQERRTRGVARALRHGWSVRRSDDLAAFWEILTARLWEAYRAEPVHTLPEIQVLRSRFPRNIHLFGCFKESKLLAGAIVYESAQVAHVQYIASTDLGRQTGALDLLFSELLTRHFNTKRYFDFGTSDLPDTHGLNSGLIDQKEGFGARAVVHDHYTISLTTWKPGHLTDTMRGA